LFRFRFSAVHNINDVIVQCVHARPRSLAGIPRLEPVSGLLRDSYNQKRWYGTMSGVLLKSELWWYASFERHSKTRPPIYVVLQMHDGHISLFPWVSVSITSPSFCAWHVRDGVPCPVTATEKSRCYKPNKQIAHRSDRTMRSAKYSIPAGLAFRCVWWMRVVERPWQSDKVRVECRPVYGPNSSVRRPSCRVGSTLTVTYERRHSQARRV